MNKEIKSIDDVVEGDRLAESVIDASGNVMVNGGVALSVAMIARLKARAVSQLVIEGGRLSAEEKERLTRKLEETVDTIFSNTDTTGLMEELRRRVLAAKIKGLESGD